VPKPPDCVCLGEGERERYLFVCRGERERHLFVCRVREREISLCVVYTYI